MKLTGNRCQCPACGEYFGSVYAFDAHRRGDHAVSRWCDTSGMVRSKRGYFVSSAKPRRAFQK